MKILTIIYEESLNIIIIITTISKNDIIILNFNLYFQ